MCRIYYHRMWGQLSTNCSNATEVAQYDAPSRSRPQTATGYSVRDGASIDLPLPHTQHRAVPPELLVFNGVNAGYKSQYLLQQMGRELVCLGMIGQYALPVQPLRV